MTITTQAFRCAADGNCYLVGLGYLQQPDQLTDDKHHRTYERWGKQVVLTRTEFQQWIIKEKD